MRKRVDKQRELTPRAAPEEGEEILNDSVIHRGIHQVKRSG